jgi:uncharacterized protein YndB with AHSA1/START domain
VDGSPGAIEGRSRARGAPTLSEQHDAVVEQTLRIHARPETVWRYWTEPERMCDWWGAAADLDPRPGGAFIVELDGGGVMRGEYLELVHHERIVFRFGWDPTDGAPLVVPGSTRVEVTLTPDGDDTILTLRHTGLPRSEVDQHLGGWGHFLSMLADAVPAAT